MLAGKATKTVVFCAILLLTVASVRAQQSKTLSIEGRIVGWDLASSLLPSYEPFDSPIHRFVVVVRIERVLKGKSKSSFLVVHVKSDKRQKARNSELEDSIVEGTKRWITNLVREKKNMRCAVKLADLKPTEPPPAPKTMTVNGQELTEIPIPRLVLNSYGKSLSLPMDEELPCYSTILKED